MYSFLIMELKSKVGKSKTDQKMKGSTVLLQMMKIPLIQSIY